MDAASLKLNKSRREVVHEDITALFDADLVGEHEQQLADKVDSGRMDR